MLLYLITVNMSQSIYYQHTGTSTLNLIKNSAAYNLNSHIPSTFKYILLTFKN